MKKLFALGLSLMMAASLTSTAFAAALPTTPPPLTDGSDYIETNGVKYLTQDGINKLVDGIMFNQSSVCVSAVTPVSGPVDEDNDSVSYNGDNVRSDEDFYITMEPLASCPVFADKDYFKVKFDKDDNGDRLRYVLITEKVLDESKGREVAFRFILKEALGDEEFKVTGTATFTAKKDIGLVNADTYYHKFEAYDSSKNYEYVLKQGGKIKVPVTAWVKNEKFEGDHDMKAGDGGIVVKPTKNDDNEINWEDENKTIANLKFEGNDDPDAFYPKLSTKWYAQAPYTALFADQDAYIYNFMGNPAINSTARATLELYNPFVNSDDELEIAPEDVFIYQVVDGQMKDVTSTFKAGENDGGDPVFTARVRQLGTYILAEQALVVPAAELTPAQAAE